MVTKLYKHEIKAYLRVWIPVQIILLTMAVCARGIQLLETEHIVYSVVNGSSVFAVVVAMVASCAFTFVYSIIRFYKNLFTTEGYLSFTLPVSVGAHLRVKLFTAAAFQLASIVMALVSGCILMAGDVFSEVVKTVVFLLGKLYEGVGWHLPFYALEIALLLFVSLIASPLLYYSCLAIGQLCNKNRILLAIGVYFAYDLIAQAIGTVISVVWTVLILFPPFIDFVSTYPQELMHVVFIGALLSTTFFGAVYAVITYCIMRYRLNLE